MNYSASVTSAPKTISAKERVVCSAIASAIGIGMLFARAWLLSLCWRWFLAPELPTVPTLRYASFLLAIVTYNIVIDHQDPELRETKGVDLLGKVFVRVLTLIVSFAFAWLLHAIMVLA